MNIPTPNLTPDFEIEGAPPIPEVDDLPRCETIKQAFDLVQEIQREFEAAPTRTRVQQAARSAIGRKLEAAKRLAFELQQGPEPPSGLATVQARISDHLSGDAEQFVREVISRRLKTKN
jgi:hypothetical protein